MKRKGSVSTDGKPAMLPSAPDGRSIKLPKLLAIEGCEVEDGGCKTILQEDDSDQLEEEAVYVETNAISKKRKASKKLKSPRFVSSIFLNVISISKPTDF